MMKEQHFKRNMTLNAAGNLLYLAAQWAVTVLVARLCDLSSAGVLSLAMSLTAIFQTVAFFGVRGFQISDVGEEFSDGHYLTLRHISALASALLALLSALLLGYRGEVLAASMLYMLFRIAESYSDVLHGMAQRKGRLDVAGIGFAIKSAALLLGFLIGFLPARSLTLGLAFMTVGSLLSTLLYDLPAVRRITPFSLLSSPRESLSLAKKTAPLCLQLFFYLSLSSLPKFVLEKMESTALLGAYASICAPALLLLAAAGYLYTPFAPAFARLCREKEERAFRLLFLKIAAALGAVLLLSLGADLLLGEWALVLLFGEKIRPHADLLSPILVAVVLTALVSFLSLLCTVRRRMLILCVGTGAGAGTTLLLSFLFIPLCGANGASYALSAGAALASLILVPAALLPRKEADR